MNNTTGLDITKLIAGRLANKTILITEKNYQNQVWEDHHEIRVEAFVIQILTRTFKNDVYSSFLV